MRTTQFHNSYLGNFIKNTKRPSPEEDRVLFEIFHNDSNPSIRDRARETIFNRHLAEVANMIKGCGHTSLEYGDIFNTAVVALGEAIDSYDPNSGASLFTYASWKTRGKLSRLFKQCEIVHIPSNKQDIKSKLKQRLSKGEELSAEELNTLQELNPQYTSTSAPLCSDSETTYEESIKDKGIDLEGSISLKEIQQLLWNGILKLKPKELEFVKRYFGLGGLEAENLNEIAKSANCSHQYIGQIKNRALKNLRSQMGDKRSYLE